MVWSNEDSGQLDAAYHRCSEHPAPECVWHYRDSSVGLNLASLSSAVQSPS